MRWGEILLFLVPFLLFGAWRLAAITAKPSLVWASVALVAVIAAGTVWLGLSRKLDVDQRYVPAHMEDGRIVEGHGTPAAAR